LEWTTDDRPPTTENQTNDEGRRTKDEVPTTDDAAEYSRPPTTESRSGGAGVQGSSGDDATAPTTPVADQSLRFTFHVSRFMTFAPADTVTLLAYLQVNTTRPEAPATPDVEIHTLTSAHAQALTRYLLNPPALPLYLHLIQALGLAEAGSAREPFKLDPERVQPFLQAAPAERLRQLAEAWRAARDWNDLRRVPGLSFEGTGWHNDPLPARQAILSLLAAVPAETWWDLDSFVAAVRERQPDFQRPAGDYDSWYIRDAAGQYLRGFENWDRVDGALVRWLITRPLHWLGLVEILPDVASGAMVPTEPTRYKEGSGGVNPPATTPMPAGFRLTPHGAAFLGQTGWEENGATGALELSPDGELRLPVTASAYDRFQLARISDWLAPDLTGENPVYVYRLTPAALARAAAMGITVARILQFLEKAAPNHPALPGLTAALLRWERTGPEAALRDTLVLKLSNPDLLDTLRRVPRLRDWLGEALGPGLVAVRREHAAQVRAALAELGILLDGD
jgi:hypothetical protein